MSLRTALVVVAVGAATSLGTFTLVRASDHLDGPAVTADPQADLTDVFAFTSPDTPGRVVLALTVTPFATDASTFSPLVDYAFRVQRVEALAPSPPALDPTPRDVVCTFDTATPQHVTCAAPGGLSATAVVGDPAGGSATGMRVFAGLRADPAFFDRQGALATVTSGAASFTGHDSFAGANVLALVVEVDRGAFALRGDAGLASGGDAGAPILAVAAETFRRGR